MSEATKKLWQTPQYRNLVCARQSTGTKKRFEDLAERSRLSESLKKALRTPEARQLKREAGIKRWASPAARHKHSEAIKKSPRAIAQRELLRHIAKPNGSERQLYSWLDKAGALYLTEKQIKIGPYFPDAYVPRLRLVIEVDGYHHRLPQVARKDRIRDEYMQRAGLVVLRIRSEDVDSGIAMPSILKALEMNATVDAL